MFKFTVIVVSLLSCVQLLRLHGLQPARLFCPQDFSDKMLEWVVITLSRGSLQPGDQTWVTVVKEMQLKLQKVTCQTGESLKSCQLCDNVQKLCLLCIQFTSQQDVTWSLLSRTTCEYQVNVKILIFYYPAISLQNEYYKSNIFHKNKNLEKTKHTICR